MSELRPPVAATPVVDPPDLRAVSGAGVRVPAWVRGMDGAALFLLVLAMCMALFGGWRYEVGEYEVISLRSPWRVWLVAMIALVARHIVWRERWLHERLSDFAWATWTHRGLRAILPAFVGSRLAIFMIAFFAVSTVGYPSPINFRVSTNEFVNLPARWDAGWYLGIATNGYRYAPHTGQQNVTFFPAYPMLMRLAAKLGGVDRQMRLAYEGVPAMYLWAGVIVSLAALLWALLYLYRMVRAVGDDEAALTAAQVALAYPVAFVYNAPYSESLLLLAAVAAFYHFGRGQLGRAAIWGLLAGLSRPNGCFLSVSLGLIAIALRWPARGVLLRAMDRLNVPPDSRSRPLLPYLLVAASPGIGMLVFSYAMYVVSGDPFVWAKLQEAWGRDYVGVAALMAPIRGISGLGLYQYARVGVYEILQVIPFLVGILLMIPIAFRLGLAYAILIPITVLPPLMAGGWLSIGRITLTLFPVYVYLGLALPASWRGAVLVSFALLQAFGATQFFTWRPFY